MQVAGNNSRQKNTPQPSPKASNDSQRISQHSAYQILLEMSPQVQKTMEAVDTESAAGEENSVAQENMADMVADVMNGWVTQLTDSKSKQQATALSSFLTTLRSNDIFRRVMTDQIPFRLESALSSLLSTASQ